MDDGPLDDESDETPQRSFLWRWTRRLILLGVVALLLVVGLYVTRERTLHPWLVRLAPTLGERFLGRSLEIGAIRGDWANSLEVDGLRLGPPASPEPLESLSFERLALDGKLLRALRKRDLGWIDSVSINAPRIVVDSEAEASPEDPEARPWAMPATSPRIDVQGGRLEIRRAGAPIVLEALSVTADGGPTASIQAEASSSNWDADIIGEMGRAPSGAWRFALEVPRGLARGVELSVNELEGRWSLDGTELTRGTVRAGANSVRIEELSFAPGPGDLPCVGGRMVLALEDLEAVDSIYRSLVDASGESPGWAGKVTGRVDLTPDPDHVATGEIVLDGSDVLVSGIRLGTVEARFRAEDERITIRSLRAEEPGIALVDGSGAFKFDERAFENVRLSARFDQPGSYGEGLAFLEGIDAQLALNGPLDAPSGRLRLRIDRLELGSNSTGRVRAEATMAAGVLDVEELDMATPFGRVTAAGEASLPLAGRALAVRLDRFQLRRGAAELALTEPTDVRVDGSRIDIVDLRLAGSAGELDLDLRVGGATGAVITGEARELRLGPFFSARPTSDAAASDPAPSAAPLDIGALNGTVTLRSDPLSARAELRLEEAPWLGEERGRAEALARWDGSRLDVERLSASFPALTMDLEGTVPLGPDGRLTAGAGAASLRGSVDLDAGAFGTSQLGALLGPDAAEWLARVEGRIAATVDLDGTLESVRGPVRLGLEAFRFLAPPADPAGTRAAAEWPEAALTGALEFEIGDRLLLRPSTLLANGGDLARLDLEGSLDASANLIQWVEDPDHWRAARLELQTALSAPDLTWASSLAPDLREAGGQLTAKATMTGTPAAPVAKGDLQLTGGTLRYRGAPALDDLELRVDFEPGRMDVTRGAFELGAAPVELSGGLRFEEEGTAVDIRLTGDDVLLARTPDARIRSDLDLHLSGLTQRMQLRGTLALSDGRVRSPVEFQRILAAGSSASKQRIRRGLSIPSFGPESLALDVDVTTKNPLRLEGRIVRGRIRADLGLRGTAAAPAPVGRLFLDPLQVAIPAGTLAFSSGLVRFEPGAPNLPELELVGTARLVGYDVTVNVEGPYDEPSVDMSSSPPLSPDELVLLTLSGQTPGRGLEGVGQSVVLYVAKDLVRGWFSSGGFEESDRRSFLDRIQVVTGRDVSREGVVTIEATYLLKEGLAREKDGVYVVLERDAYEDYGLGLRLVLRLR